MSAPAETYRLERKFLVEELDVHEVRALVHLHPALFRRIYAPRWVNNVYFDTPGLHAYHDNVDGSMRRAKARVRWYGDAEGAETATLELKLRQGLVGSKDSYPLGGFDVRRDASREGVLARLADGPEAAAARIALESQTPVLRNRYRREYFRSADRRFRLTLDSHLRYQPIEPGYGDAHVDRGVRPVVVELKYDVGDDARVHAVASWFPFRMTKNSKYTTGLATAWALRGRRALDSADPVRVGRTRRAGSGLN